MKKEDIETVEFRCKKCNKLLAKVFINSNIEIKCRGCKSFNYFIQGIITNEDTNNYFKGDE